MAKRKRTMTKNKIERWIEEGRGQGEGGNYKPWLTIQDVPSEGVATRDKGWKTSRQHHLLSELELNYFFTLEWSDIVIDIREQYPLLPQERTIEIAESLGIKHPTDPKTGELTVMTTDFMITVIRDSRVEIIARTVKPSNKLKKREIEKFAIEQCFYYEQGIDWAIVLDNDIPWDFIKNMDSIYKYKFLDNYPGVNESIAQRMMPILYEEVYKNKETTVETFLKCDEKFGLESGTCIGLAKYYIANKIWEIDLTKRIDFSQRLNITKIENRFGWESKAN